MTNASPEMLMSGYEPKTTFWTDFTIADKFGKNAIKDTFDRAFEEWKSNYIYLTELVMVLNHKMWFWSEKNEEIARLYLNIWQQADVWASENLKDTELEYFYRTLD